MLAAEIKWGCGILSAPRAAPTLPRCYGHLDFAGWTDPILLIDSQRSGCYRGWLEMARLVLSSRPHADWLLLIEDDCQLTAGLRAWLEANPPDPLAWNSLYCAGGLHSDAADGWREVQAPRQCWGSVGYVIKPELLRVFLDNVPFPTWRDGTDRAIGSFCHRRHVPYKVHSPSLAFHLGEMSSLDWPAGVAENRQCKKWIERITRMDGDDGDAWLFQVVQPGDRSASAPQAVEYADYPRVSFDRLFGE